MWSGSQSSCHHISDQPKAWEVDILSHGWLAGQLQLASWLAGWLPSTQNVNLTYLPNRDIWWPCVWLHWSIRPVVRWTSVRCTPSSNISGQLAIWPTSGSGWPVIRHTTLVEASQVSLPCGQLVGQAALSSDIPPIEPSRGIWWPRVTLHNINLIFGQHLGQVDLSMWGYIWCQQPG